MCVSLQSVPLLMSVSPIEQTITEVSNLLGFIIQEKSRCCLLKAGVISSYRNAEISLAENESHDKLQKHTLRVMLIVVVQGSHAFPRNS